MCHNAAVPGLRSLKRQGYRARLIDTAAPSFTRDVRRIDVAFLAIAGQYAEDGKLQGFLETLRIPYTYGLSWARVRERCWWNR